MIVLSDDSDDERVQEGWFPEMEGSRAYKDAVLVLSTRKYCKHQGKPLDLADLQTLLAKFLNEPAPDHFSGARKKKFNDLKAKLLSTYSNVTSTRSKKWPRAYVASMLAGLVLLSREEKEAKGRAQRPTSTRTSRHKKSPMKSSSLDKKFKYLHAIFDESHIIFSQERLVERNKKHKTPSLSHQLSGNRMQDSFAFDPKKLLVDACAVCGHRSMMRLDDIAVVDAENNRRRAAASAHGGDGKFEAITSVIGCNCYRMDPCIGAPDGTGCGVCEAIVASAEEQNIKVDLEKEPCKCVCQVKYEQQHHRAIALAIEKNRINEKKQKKAEEGSSKKSPPEEVSAAAEFYKHLDDAFENERVRQCQHVDERSDAQLIQDTATAVANSLLSDPSIAVNPEVRRSLSKLVPLKAAVNYRMSSGTKKMSLSEARKMALKESKKASHEKMKPIIAIDSDNENTPGHDTFTHNGRSSNSTISVEVLGDKNRSRRNRLSHVPLRSSDTVPARVSLGSTEDPSMMQRVRKRATKKFMDKDTTPSSKKRAKSIRQRCIDGDEDIKTGIEDMEPADSQEAYNYADMIVADA